MCIRDSSRRASPLGAGLRAPRLAASLRHRGAAPTAEGSRVHLGDCRGQQHLGHAAQEVLPSHPRRGLRLHRLREGRADAALAVGAARALACPFAAAAL
eukprot:1007880-Pyramimonas_sp.AAC.1